MRLAAVALIRRPPHDGAILDVPVGKGRVLLYPTNPCYRWQNHGAFNTLFSAILAWNDLAPKEVEAAAKP